MRRFLAQLIANSPEDRLRRAVRDLEDEVPQLNEALALLKAQVTVAERSIERSLTREAELLQKVDAAVAQGRPDVAACYQETLAEVRRWRGLDEQELEAARAAYAQAQAGKRAFMAAKEQRIHTTREALRAKRQAEWTRAAAELLDQLAGRLEDGQEEHDALTAELRAEARAGEAGLRAAIERLIDASGVRDSEA